MSRIKQIILDIAIAILFLSCIIFGVKVFKILNDYNENKKAYNSLNDIYTESKEESREAVFENLYQINDDYLGWIKIQGTNINYPIVHTKNNDYYLTHNFYKEENPGGAIFMDYENTSLEDNYVVIYGHYMKNNTMFSEIHKYKDESFFNENKEITIDTKDCTYVYEIFSCYISDPNFNYNVIPSNKEEFIKFTEQICKKNKFNSNVIINKEDSILTLSTCSYEYNDARMILHARLVEKR